MAISDGDDSIIGQPGHVDRRPRKVLAAPITVQVPCVTNALAASGFAPQPDFFGGLRRSGCRGRRSHSLPSIRSCDANWNDRHGAGLMQGERAMRLASANGGG
jgi:hypothetical protein